MSPYWGDLLAVSTALVWSFAVIFFRWGSDNIGTLPLKIFHNLVATVLFFICIPVFSQPWMPSLTASEWTLVLVSALLGITIGDTLYVAAIRRIGAGGQALLDCLYAPTIILLAFFAFEESFSLWGWVGSSLIIAAVFIAHQAPADSLTRDLKSHRIGLLYGILSQFAMALCIILIRDILRKDSVLAITAYRYIFGTLSLMILAWPRHSWGRMFSGFQWNQSLKSSLMGTFLGPFLATLLWFASFKYTTAGRAAIYNQLSTIFIILLAWIFLKEPLTRPKLVAVVLAVAGGYLVAIS